jgi:hypothetical protein
MFRYIHIKTGISGWRKYLFMSLPPQMKRCAELGPPSPQVSLTAAEFPGTLIHLGCVWFYNLEE